MRDDQNISETKPGRPKVESIKEVENETISQEQTFETTETVQILNPEIHHIETRKYGRPSSSRSLHHRKNIGKNISWSFYVISCCNTWFLPRM